MDDMLAFAPPPPSPEEIRRRLYDRVKAIIQRLDKEADRRTGRRTEAVERRWIDDLRQYHGKYDTETASRLAASGGSRVFINQTRPKTNAMSARLTDLLFPTDDRNWGIDPTPVPELARDAEDAAQKAIKARMMAEQAVQQGAPQADQIVAIATKLETVAADLKARIDEARGRADMMAEEIEDQLVECRYAAAARDVIEDACKIGTGILKGPIVGAPKQAWSQGEGGYQLSSDPNPRPCYFRVDPWSFFPDPDVRSLEDSDGIFERHLMNERALRRMARTPGFDADAIRRLLGLKAHTSTPQFYADLRAISGDTASLSADLYQVWEYHGTLTAEEMQDIALVTGQTDMLDDLGDPDPLDEMSVVIWFCQGEILKFGESPMDSGECLYSVFNLEKDEASVFGYGVPYLMRDSQRALNGAWRMLLDNGGLSTGPQIEIDPEIIEPSNNDYTLEARKIWMRKNGSDKAAPGIRTYEINSHQAELGATIEAALKFIDDETAMPLISQGEQGAKPTPTLGGMTILMNSANVVFRRIVKNFDDDLTVPVIRRAYHWNMQHSPKDHIKGDYQVDARGSSVLLVREMQAQTLMAMALQFGAHPTYAPMLKHPALLRRIFQAQMLSADEMVYTDAELKQAAAAASAEEDPRVQIERDKLAAQIEIANMETATRLKVAELAYQTAMMKLAEELNMSQQQIEAKMEETRAKIDSDERRHAVELATTQQIGPSGGGLY